MAKGKSTPATMSETELRAYILDTVERLKLLTQRLETYVEERYVGEQGTEHDVDRGEGE